MSLLSDQQQKARHDRYIDAARTAWEETNNEEEFDERMKQIHQEYSDVELFIGGWE